MTDPTAKADSQKGDALPADWVDEHADALYRFALRRVRDQHVIEDLLQETYLAAYKSQHTFRGESTVRTWLIAILRLKIIDHFRRKARDAKREESLQQQTPQDFRTEPVAPWDCRAAHTFENQEFWSAFESCVQKLPATLARAFLMREVDGCEVAEVCQILDISSSNLAVRIYRARTSMRDCLDINWFSKDWTEMQLLRKLQLILTIECEHASRLTSESLERKLSWHQRAALRMHTFVCKSCRRFESQLRFLRDALRESGKRELESLDDGPQLDTDFKTRLKQLRK